ncbi:MAG: FKBP-type peptidyl-prolyl cis-trans isomerase [Aliivibrio sp.]|uniref:FKBP-type peptidyl-prolyl cis-trans isomerase n=1 Tax=Aliivibrio sp. TaxID=1872443 RepID=UPI001A5C9320|nr:FKBP-type peptidyl-prolyl cis-trans isomerase [Aliivibrio sp.]
MSVIKKNSEVLMHFTIKLHDGSVADSTANSGKPAKFVMGDGSLSDNFEKCLLGLEADTKHSLELDAEDAFGMPNPDNIHHMDRSKFVGESKAEVGTIMAFSSPDGMEVPGIITEVVGNSVTVDFNHPLAGQDVIFDIEIISVNNV